MRVITEVLNKHVTRYFEEKRNLELAFETFSGEEIARELVALNAAIKGSVDNDKYKTIVDAFVKLYLARRHPKVTGIAPLENTQVVIAAIRAGIIEGLTENEVGDMRAYQVVELTRQVSAVLSASFDVPKN